MYHIQALPYLPLLTLLCQRIAVPPFYLATLQHSPLRSNSYHSRLQRGGKEAICTDQKLLGKAWSMSVHGTVFGYESRGIMVSGENWVVRLRDRTH